MYNHSDCLWYVAFSPEDGNNLTPESTSNGTDQLKVFDGTLEEQQLFCCRIMTVPLSDIARLLIWDFKWEKSICVQALVRRSDVSQ